MAGQRDLDEAQGMTAVEHRQGAWARENLAALRAHRPELCPVVQAWFAGNETGISAAGEPWSGIASHLDTVPLDAQGLVVFLGMGFGHGPLLVLRERPAIIQMAILEPSLPLFCSALAATDLRPLIADKRVRFFVGEFDWQDFEEAVSRAAALVDTHILRHVPSFQRQPGLYGAVNDRAYMLLNQINASGSTTRQCGPIFVENRFANLTLLRHSHNLDALRGSCQGKPAILVAAGPSLNGSLAQLRQCVGKCVLIAADSALAPLLKAGVVPDFVTSIDYLDLNFEKLAPFLGEEWPFSLVTSVKGGALVAKRFPARHLFFAFADDHPQRWLMEALGVKTLTAAFSSVAHLSLGLALIMGCDPVVLVGQDLSYTTALGDHASGTIIMRDALPGDREIFEVPAVGGGKVPTDRQFLSLLKTFEDIISSTPRRYVNASAAGARIGGTMEMDLAAVARQFLGGALPVDEIVAHALSVGPSYRVDHFIAVARRQFVEAGKVEQDLGRALALGEQALAGLAPAALKGGGREKFADLPARLRKLLGEFDRLNGAIDAVEPVWTPMLELTFGMLSDNDRHRERNESLGQREGYLPWVRAELERINDLNRKRLAAVEGYRASLGRLLDHLETEEGGNEDAPTLEHIGLHLAAKDYALARRLLFRMQKAGQADQRLWLYSGQARAGMLDFAGADADWGRAAAMAPQLGDAIATVRHDFTAEWFAFVERYGKPGTGGDNFPHLLPGWVSRMVGAAGTERGKATRLLAPFFAAQAERLEQWLGEGREAEKDEIAPFLRAWALVGEETPAYAAFRARCHGAWGEHELAVSAMEQALLAEPANGDRLVFVVRSLLSCGRYPEAIARLRQAVALNPEVALLWEEIGDLLFAAADDVAALSAYEHCFLALPDRVESLLKMGRCYLRRGEIEAAVAAFEGATKRSPDHVEARRMLDDARQEARQHGG